MLQAKRVCVIGAGPSGMSVLYHFNRLKTQGKEIPEIVCYDKQSDWGGLWIYSWETGKEFTMKIFFWKTTGSPGVVSKIRDCAIIIRRRAVKREGSTM